MTEPHDSPWARPGSDFHVTPPGDPGAPPDGAGTPPAGTSTPGGTVGRTLRARAETATDASGREGAMGAGTVTALNTARRAPDGEDGPPAYSGTFTRPGTLALFGWGTGAVVAIGLVIVLVMAL